MNEQHETAQVPHQEQHTQRTPHSERILFAIFKEEGLLFVPIAIETSTGTLQVKKTRMLKGVTEQNILRNNIVKAYVQAAFFPFSYKVVAIVPHCFGRSMLFKMGTERTQPKQEITEEELGSFFSQTVWKSLEEQKKNLGQKTKFDDMTTLLVHNTLLEARIGKKSCVEGEIDSIIGQIGSGMEFGFLRSFVYRPLFAGLGRILPARGRIISAFEQGFGIPLEVYLKHAREKKDRAFICASVQETETDIFAYDGKTLMYCDSFSFGYRTLYDAFHAKLHVDFASFERMLQAFSEGNVSVSVRAYFDAILSEEIKRFLHGVDAFKKNLGITTHVIDGGKLSFLFERHKKIAPYLIARDETTPQTYEGEDVHAHLRTTRLFMTKSLLGRLATKFIRWLIPHTVEMQK